MRSRRGQTPASSLPQKLFATVDRQRRAEALLSRDLHDRDTEGGSVVVPGILPEVIKVGYTATDAEVSLNHRMEAMEARC